jgi:Fur family peroxide stress response transcriptional regulator
MLHLRDQLQSKGLKATHQRLVIYQAALNCEVHPSAEWVYEALKQDHPSLSLGTVYKTLASLEEVGLLRKMETTDGQLRYDAKTHDHHHIFCANTREIMDFEDEELNEVIKTFLAKKHINNLSIRSVSLHITGWKEDPLKQIEVK